MAEVSIGWTNENSVACNESSTLSWNRIISVYYQYLFTYCPRVYKYPNLISVSSSEQEFKLKKMVKNTYMNYAWNLKLIF